jgi:hypothetical protein
MEQGFKEMLSFIDVRYKYAKSHLNQGKRECSEHDINE